MTEGAHRTHVLVTAHNRILHTSTLSGLVLYGTTAHRGFSTCACVCVRVCVCVCVCVCRTVQPKYCKPDVSVRYNERLKYWLVEIRCKVRVCVCSPLCVRMHFSAVGHVVCRLGEVHLSCAFWGLCVRS